MSSPAGGGGGAPRRRKHVPPRCGRVRMGAAGRRGGTRVAVSAEDGKQRIGRLMTQLGGQVDALLCMSPENIYFLTGFRTMLYTRFAAAVVRFDEPDSPALVASSVDRALVASR